MRWRAVGGAGARGDGGGVGWRGVNVANDAVGTWRWSAAGTRTAAGCHLSAVLCMRALRCFIELTVCVAPAAEAGARAAAACGACDAG